jgi:predicted DsbA family dithiol-disulfide isomerase
MAHTRGDDRPGLEVTIWFDPVCPFSWNTTHWLTAVADKIGLSIDWQLMSLAVLNLTRHENCRHHSRRGCATHNRSAG